MTKNGQTVSCPQDDATDTAEIEKHVNIVIDSEISLLDHAAFSYNSFNELEENRMRSYNDFIELIGCGTFQVLISIYHAFAWIIVNLQYPLMIFLPVVLRCEWQIGIFQMSLISSINRIGLCLGTITTGPIMDYFGKKYIYIISSALSSLVYLVCPFSTNILSIYVCSFMIGFTGSTFTSIDGYYIDFSPKKYYAQAVSIGHFAGSLTILIGQEISYIVIDQFNWKIWLYISSIPSIITFILSFFLPFCPRKKLRCGDISTCYKILSKAARINGSTLPDEKYLIREEENKNSFQDLFGHMLDLKFIPTLSLFATTFCTGFCYTAITLNVPDLQDEQKEILSSFNASECIFLTKKQNNNYLIRSSAEIVSFFIALGITLIKRKSAFKAMYLIAAIAQGLCFIPNKTLELCLNFLIRAVSAVLLDFSFIYSGEYFPSYIRAFGMGLSYSIFVVGAMLSPFYVNYSKIISPISYNIGLIVVFLIGDILCCFMIETKEKEIR